jgi:hypothetical protein
MYTALAEALLDAGAPVALEVCCGHQRMNDGLLGQVTECFLIIDDSQVSSVISSLVCASQQCWTKAGSVTQLLGLSVHLVTICSAILFVGCEVSSTV